MRVREPDVKFILLGCVPCHGVFGGLSTNERDMVLHNTDDLAPLFSLLSECMCSSASGV